jgi:hypothetical protein
MPYVTGSATKKASGVIRRLMAVYARAEDMINIGAYRNGSNPETDYAIEKHGLIENFLIQEVDEPSTIEETLSSMSYIAGVEIPEEEMADNNEKLLANAGRISRKEKSVKETQRAIPADNNAMALNSVASLFSSMPASSVFNAN